MRSNFIRYGGGGDKDFNRKISLEQDLERLRFATGSNRNEYEGVWPPRRLRPQGGAGAGDRPDVDCAPPIRRPLGFGKSPIVLEQSTLKGWRPAARCAHLSKRFLAIAGDPDDPHAQCARWPRCETQHLTRRSISSKKPCRLHGARGIDTKVTRLSTSFGRGVDYYTASEFELHAKGNGVEPLVAGGSL